MSDISLSWTYNIIGHSYRISSDSTIIFRLLAWIYSDYTYAWCMITIESDLRGTLLNTIVIRVLLSCRGNCYYMQQRLTMQIFYRQMLWSSQLIACDGRQLINLVASMYEYPKEILIFGRNINQPLTTANIGGYFIFDIASCREPARKIYTVMSFDFRIRHVCWSVVRRSLAEDSGQEVVSHHESTNYKFLLSYNVFPSEISYVTKTAVKMQLFREFGFLRNIRNN